MGDRSTRRMAIGCSDHTGWAVLVSVAGDAARPEVVDRRRVELVDPSLPRQAYHAAAGLPLDEATRLIEQVGSSALEVTEHQLRSLRADLDRLDAEVAGLAVADAADVPADLATVLAKHPLLHAGEAALYRDALVDAASSIGLAVTRFEHRDAIGQAAVTAGMSAEELGARLTALRRDLGAPWNADHRRAAAAALLVLSSG